MNFPKFSKIKKKIIKKMGFIFRKQTQNDYERIRVRQIIIFFTHAFNVTEIKS